MLNGDTEITETDVMCQADSTWQDLSTVSCTPKSCGYATQIENGKM